MVKIHSDKGFFKWLILFKKKKRETERIKYMTKIRKVRCGSCAIKASYTNEDKRFSPRGSNGYISCPSCGCSILIR